MDCRRTIEGGGGQEMAGIRKIRTRKTYAIGSGRPEGSVKASNKSSPGKTRRLTSEGELGLLSKKEGGWRVLERVVGRQSGKPRLKKKGVQYRDHAKRWGGHHARKVSQKSFLALLEPR